MNYHMTKDQIFKIFNLKFEFENSKQQKQFEIYFEDPTRIIDLYKLSEEEMKLKITSEYRQIILSEKELTEDDEAKFLSRAYATYSGNIILKNQIIINDENNQTVQFDFQYINSPEKDLPIFTEWLPQFEFIKNNLQANFYTESKNNFCEHYIKFTLGFDKSNLSKITDIIRKEFVSKPQDMDNAKPTENYCFQIHKEYDFEIL